MVMANIYIICGDYDAAIDELDYVMSLEAEYTANELKLTSWLDPLRDNPRYRELIKRYSSDLLVDAT